MKGLITGCYYCFSTTRA